MGRLAIVVALFCFSGVSHAEDLFCKGVTWFNGQRSDDSRVLKTDFPNHAVSINTYNGMAVGTVKIDGTSYLGFLRTPSGKAYSFNFDRYSGELNLIQLPDSGVINQGDTLQTEFTAVCDRTQPRF